MVYSLIQDHLSDCTVGGPGGEGTRVADGVLAGAGRISAEHVFSSTPSVRARGKDYRTRARLTLTPAHLMLMWELVSRGYFNVALVIGIV